MARGQVLQIASGTNQTVSTQSREEKPSFVVYNPNDGVCYFKINGLSSPQAGGYDWKLPAQSGGAFGGPWQSLGIYFLDQSGAGRQGEINLFDSDQEVQIPNIWAIGRSLQAQVNTVDITEGVIPANPAAGVARLWVDNNDVLHILDSVGTDESEISTRTVLGGVLTGTLPNPGLVAGAATAIAYIVQGSSTSTTSTTVVLLTNFTGLALTTKGGLVLARVAMSASGTLAGNSITFYIRIDGGAWQSISQAHVNNAGYEISFAGAMAFAPAVGNHTWDLGWAVSGGTANMNANVNSAFTLEELRA